MQLQSEETSIRILLVEDEVMIAEETAMALRAMGYSQPDYANSYEEALQKVEGVGADLLLLDIDLGDAQDRDGIHLAARIQQDRTIPVIFLTQHPVSTFRSRLKGVQKVGYLTKSFNLDNLHAAIEVALDTMDVEPEPVPIPIHPVVQEPTGLSFIGDRFFVRKANRYHCYQVSELLYIQAHDSYCDVVFWVNDRKETIRLSINLKEVSSQINQPSLFRVHRSYAINVEKLTAFEGNRLFLGQEEIPVGPSYREDFLAKLNILGRGK